MLNTYIDKLVDQIHGQFFTVTFQKKDGSIRTLNCRTGVKKYLKGGERTTNPDEYLIVYSIKDEGYRNVKKDKILEIVAQGTVVYSTISVTE